MKNLKKMKYYILTMATLLFAINSFAQNVIIDNEVLPPVDVNKTKVIAKKTIRLLPGFTTSGYSSFHATIDPFAPIGTNADGTPYNGYTSGETSTKNYVKTYTAAKDYQFTDPNSLTSTNSNISYQYFDGLGRPIQTVQIKASPEGRDIVQPVKYDDYGRVAKGYLPYAVRQDGNTEGGFRQEAFEEQKNYYKQVLNEGDYAFSEKFFENSPLNRVLQTVASGQAWHTNNKHVILGYETNTGTEVIIWTVNQTTGALIKGNNYAAGELYKNSTTDEDGHSASEYKNKLGQVILSISDNAKTYYVYDDFGLLRWVLPPKASADDNISGAEETSLCYYYEYDDRKRMVLKKLPGAEPIYMVYDKRDLLVATQDGELRKSHKWMFTKYDKFSRPVITGEYQAATNTTPTALKTIVDAASSLWETYNITSNTYSLDQAFPTSITINDIYRETYYDYDYLVQFLITSNDYYEYENIYGIEESTRTKGQIMASKTRVLLHDGLTVDKEWLYTVNYYDKYGRVIQTIADNHRGGFDRISNKYNFAGELLETKQSHNITGSESNNLDIVKEFTYDRMGRLLTEKEQVGSGTKITTAANEYDEMGQLTSNKIGNGKQTIDYKYNIRGWMTHINNPASLGTDLFAMQLKYNDHATSSKRTYNGNISQISWKSKNFTSLKTYDFTYDGLNRLTKADYTDGTKYDVSFGYDLNGNILSLDRYGKKADNSFALIDDLTYSYSGNQLIKVDDVTGSQSDGFSDNGSGVATEYFYDANGNMYKDLNKKIGQIDYNILNLPNRIQMSTAPADYMDYIYDAAGIKLSKHTPDGITDYIGNMIYENGLLKYILTSQGRIVVDGTNYNDRQYFIKDHLGNTRVTFDATGKVLQEDSYYPFGMTMNGMSYTAQSLIDNDSKNKYLYNGKELQTDLGLDWYDYGARFYDAQIGRWHSVDPLAESYISLSPYHFSGNNPILYLDDNGMNYNPIYDFDGNFLGTDDKGLQGEAIVMNKNDFEQGMNHTDALNKGELVSDWFEGNNFTGMETGLEILSHANSLMDRPDWDGYLTIEEGVEWAHNTAGMSEDDPNKAVYLDASKLDLGSLSIDDFNEIGKPQLINLLYFYGSVPNDVIFAYGNNKMTLLNNQGDVKMGADKFDYDYHERSAYSILGQPKRYLRNTLIFGVRIYQNVDDRHSFNINTYGVAKLK